MTNCTYLSPNSWFAKREVERRQDYVSLYNPGKVFVNRLELEKKQERARLKQQEKEEKAALRQARHDEFIAARNLKKEAKLEQKAQRKAQIQENGGMARTILKGFQNFTKNLFTPMTATSAVDETDFAIAKSLEDSAVEFDVERRDAMIELLKQGKYEEFRNSEYAQMPLDELYAIFDFEDYGYINEPEKINTDRVIGKPLNKRKNKSTTLNYLRKNRVIDITKLLEHMKEEQFGTVLPGSAEELLRWANHANGEKAVPRITNDAYHNCMLGDLRVEIASAYNSLYADARKDDKILLFPSGDTCKMSDFFRAA